jgi:transcriptional regulator with XRE-family HTH domain
MSAFAHLIRTARAQAGLSRRAMADRVGRSHTTLKRLEEDQPDRPVVVDDALLEALLQALPTLHRAGVIQALREEPGGHRLFLAAEGKTRPKVGRTPGVRLRAGGDANQPDVGTPDATSPNMRHADPTVATPATPPPAPSLVRRFGAPQAREVPGTHITEPVQPATPAATAPSKPTATTRKTAQKVSGSQMDGPEEGGPNARNTQPEPRRGDAPSAGATIEIELLLYLLQSSNHLADQWADTARLSPARWSMGVTLLLHTLTELGASTSDATMVAGTGLCFETWLWAQGGDIRPLSPEAQERFPVWLAAQPERQHALTATMARLEALWGAPAGAMLPALQRAFVAGIR